MTTEFERPGEFGATTAEQPHHDDEPRFDDQSRAEFRPPTEAPSSDPEAAPGYAEAFEAAERASEPGALEGFIERMAERVGGKASVRAVFGDPIQGDGFTIIPVAKVRWGFGGGSGSGPIAVGPGRTGHGSPFSDMADDASAETSQTGSGSGAGGGVTAEPVGYLEIGPDGASFQPITEARPSPAFLLAAGVTAAIVLRGLARLIRR